MPKPAKGLYHPIVVDLVFAAMGGASAFALFRLQSPNSAVVLDASERSLAGPLLLGCVILCGVAACLYHRVDRRGWDDYMGQVFQQSAVIALVSLIMAAVAADLIAAKVLGAPIQLPLVSGTVPMAGIAWSLGYFFLRWRGTGE